MSSIQDAIQEVFLNGKAIFIPCRDARNQESIRTMAFHARNRILKSAGYEDNIGVAKVEKDGRLFVKVYVKEDIDFFKEDENGKLVLIEKPLSKDLQRVVELMKKDGVAEEEIQETIRDWKEE